jgi:phosphatidylglycerol---prolipoprotein diacylglyceryl transferase
VACRASDSLVPRDQRTVPEIGGLTGGRKGAVRPIPTRGDTVYTVGMADALNLLFPLNLSSLCYALGYGIGVLAFALMAHRRGMDFDAISGIAVAGLVGGMVGANVTQLLFGGGVPGKTVLGGVAVGYVAVVLYKKFARITRPTGDLFAVAMMAGEAVGRFGCYFGGCCYGKPTALPWAVYQHDAWRHPTQVYLALASSSVLALLLYREFRRPLPENGLFYLQGALYCAARFAVEFWRDGAHVHAGLTTAQWACLVGVAFFAARYRRLTRPASTPSSSAEGKG